MEKTKDSFIEQANKKGIIAVRERNPKEDLGGYGALEFILSDGTVFVISPMPFGQGNGEDGLWIDMNAYSDEALAELKCKIGAVSNF